MGPTVATGDVFSSDLSSMFNYQVSGEESLPDRDLLLLQEMFSRQTSAQCLTIRCLVRKPSRQGHTAATGDVFSPDLSSMLNYQVSGEETFETGTYGCYRRCFLIRPQLYA